MNHLILFTLNLASVNVLFCFPLFLLEETVDIRSCLPFPQKLVLEASAILLQVLKSLVISISQSTFDVSKHL